MSTYAVRLSIRNFFAKKQKKKISSFIAYVLYGWPLIDVCHCHTYITISHAV